MSPTIFLTGVSGYIGGQTAGVIVEKHPEWKLVTLVRDEKQAQIINSTWPTVETVVGDLDNHEVLVEQSKRADVVLQMASADHIPAVKSIIEGLSLGKKGRYIHTSGSGILHDVPNGYGNPSNKIYHDVADIKEITSLDMSRVHRDADAAVIETGVKYGVPTAIISPDTIHGVGSGPIKKRSIQIPFLIESTLKRGKAFTVGDGNNIWDNVHVSDIASAYVLLAEEALKPNGGKAAWGPEGYYFTSATDHAWVDVATSIAKIAHSKGAISSAEVDNLSVEEASKVHPWAPLLWGGNCRSRSDRFRALGWKPTGPSVFESLPEMVDFEIKALGTQTNATTF